MKYSFFIVILFLIPFEIAAQNRQDMTIERIAIHSESLRSQRNYESLINSKNNNSLREEYLAQKTAKRDKKIAENKKAQEDLSLLNNELNTAKDSKDKEKIQRKIDKLESKIKENESFIKSATETIEVLKISIESEKVEEEAKTKKKDD